MYQHSACSSILVVLKLHTFVFWREHVQGLCGRGQPLGGCVSGSGAAGSVASGVANCQAGCLWVRGIVSPTLLAAMMLWQVDELDRVAGLLQAWRWQGEAHLCFTCFVMGLHQPSTPHSAG